MDLKELQRNWNQLGKRDPLWAILMWNDKKDNKWDPDEFFETGKQEIKDVMQYVAKLGLLQQRGRALDFGCGAGRLTQALATYFESVVGIDIAPRWSSLPSDITDLGRAVCITSMARTICASFQIRNFTSSTAISCFST